MAAATSSPNHVGDDHNFTDWPLNSTRGPTDTCNLQHYKMELDQKSARLFVDSLVACKFEWWKIVRSEAEEGFGMARPCYGERIQG